MIRQLSVLALLSFLAMACSNGGGVVLDRNSLFEELSIGEYLQNLGSDRLLTFSRKDSSVGLVSIQMKTPQQTELEVLDPDAGNGHDLMVSKKHAVYRIGTQVRFLNLESKTIVPLLERVQKILSFYWLDKTGFLGVQYNEWESTGYFFDASGKVLQQTSLRGSVRQAFEAQGSLWIVSQVVKPVAEAGLYLSRWNPQKSQWDLSFLVQSGFLGSYVQVQNLPEKSLSKYRGRFLLAFLNDDQGTFDLASKALSDLDKSSPFEIETIDGKKDETYVGQDPVGFLDSNGQPGYFYLDAWKLRLRWVRWNESKKSWIAAELPFEGALGFYPQVLKVEKGAITISFNTFRTQKGAIEKSYDDLIWARIKAD